MFELVEDFFVPVLLFCCLAGFALLLIAASPLGPQLTIDVELAAIEQLRADMGKAPCPIGDHVAGQVASYNRKIRRKQAWNDKWWAALWIPNEWDDVRVIEFPDCGNSER